MSGVCASCGRATNDHDRHVRFGLPDPVLSRRELLDSPDFWSTDPDPTVAVMMVVPEMGGFIRALFPVKMTENHTLTYGVWVGVDEPSLHRAFEVWWSPEYSSLTIDGRLANRIEPWGLLASPVELMVLDQNATPYCTSSTDPICSHALTHEWDHATVLGDTS